MSFKKFAKAGLKAGLHHLQHDDQAANNGGGHDGGYNHGSGGGGGYNHGSGGHHGGGGYGGGYSGGHQQGGYGGHSSPPPAPAGYGGGYQQQNYGGQGYGQQGGYNAGGYNQQQQGYAPQNPYGGGYQQQQNNYPPPGNYSPPPQHHHPPPQSNQYSPPHQQPAAPYASGGSGRRKALLIGINYTANQKLRLRGCVNDIVHMSTFLSRKYGFSTDPSSMMILVDDKYNGPGRVHGQPTRENILRGFSWLTQGARQGDNYFFHYSGHGSQLRDQDGDEKDGLDETIIPCDYRGQPNMQIRDDTLYDMLVAPLPTGAHMTAVMDCCHSGTGMDLPYVFTANQANMACFVDGKFDPSKLPSMLMSEAGKINWAHGVDGKKLAAHGVKFLGKLAVGFAQNHFGGGGGGGEGGFQTEGKKFSYGTVVLLSGCADTQTSADVGTKGGACTNALIEVLSHKADISTIELLEEMRLNLKRKGFRQVPQLSSTHRLDLGAKFLLVA